MTEDEVFRTTTQYRLWSYTQDTLATLRISTNSRAAARVRDALRRIRSQKETSVQHEGNGHSESASQVNCLTVEEEQKLVGFYCVKAMEFADFCEFPTNVKATAVQYLKRFYLSNSPMTYHPKQMMPSALFLSTKTENHYISLKNFVAKLPKTTAEDVVAPEFLLTQALRFTFDVRHPQRGLEGGFMELLAISTGTYQPPPGSKASSKSLQQEMLQLAPLEKANPKAKSSTDLKTRIQIAHGKAKEALKTSALLTDAYFLYTPSQIWLAAFMKADEPLARFYLETKFSESGGVPSRLLSTLQQCIALLAQSPAVKPGEVEIKELTRIDKKLYKCRNPEKMDLVGINKARKREGEPKDEAALDEKALKKRKLEHASRDSDDMFGPTISK
ncbi:hypothetical protein MMC11_006395 [Xylographa trunciseda]|nr:hypothetical protein [Xylographa trunciseda]